MREKRVRKKGNRKERREEIEEGREERRMGEKEKLT